MKPAPAHWGYLFPFLAALPKGSERAGQQGKGNFVSGQPIRPLMRKERNFAPHLVT